MGHIIGTLADYIDVVVIVFFGLLLAVFALFSIERAAYKVYMMLRVRTRWFPEGKFVLICTTGEPVWDDYLNNVLLPDCGEYAVMVDANEAVPGLEFERKLAEQFTEEAGHEPTVVVFLPYFEFREYRFGDAVNSPEEYRVRALAKAREPLMDVVDEQIDRMRVYI